MACRSFYNLEIGIYKGSFSCVEVSRCGLYFFTIIFTLLLSPFCKLSLLACCSFIFSMISFFPFLFSGL
ncbi:hypothetical protein HOY80DRAFT_985257 [Tuber brumale]|nr:hypothetical protein HOY80DRAFT_985257 [Tuber brumale]